MNGDVILIKNWIGFFFLNSSLNNEKKKEHHGILVDDGDEW